MLPANPLSFNTDHFISAFISLLCPIITTSSHRVPVISAKMVGTARVTTTMARESTKRGSTATQSTIRVPRRALRDDEVRRSASFRPTILCELLIYGATRFFNDNKIDRNPVVYLCT